MHTFWIPRVAHKLETLSRLLLGVMGLASVIVFGHGVSQTLATGGGTDFHSYWYYGHFVRQGVNPYRAFFEHQELSVPIGYLDGETAETLPVAQPGLASTPANTAPMVLLLSSFSFFSWPSAKTLWMLCNLLFTLVTPWLVIALLPDRGVLGASGKLLLSFVFYLLQGTRIANWTGQTTLFVFVLMLGALLALDRNWKLSGILLALALSKYSLALPVFVFVLYKRKYRVIGIGLVVQMLGLLLVAVIGRDSPGVLVQNYMQMIRHHAALPGIHLASLFSASSVWPYFIAFVGTLVGGRLLWVALSRLNEPASALPVLSFADWHVLVILALWSLLVTYHRAYDTLIVILFIALVIYGLVKIESWRLSKRQGQALTIFLMVFVAVLSVPSSLMGPFLPQHLMPTWYQVVSNVMMLTLVLALGCAIWLSYNIVGLAAEASTIQGTRKP